MSNKSNFEIVSYSDTYIDVWNDFLKTSKNGTFLFNRNYMDYHKERFVDASLLIYKDDKIVGLFPANEKGRIIQTHGGLSYGGLIYSTKLRTKDVIDILQEICEYFRNKQKNTIYYKTVPSIYHSSPSMEDRYALFVLNAIMYRRDVSSTIDLENRIKLSKGRKWLLNRAKKENVQIEKLNNFEDFFTIYNKHLKEKYGISAVHTANELKLLKERFPLNIEYISASKDNEFLGGTILYISSNVIHAQYIHITNEGKNLGAFDLLLEKVLLDYSNKKYFDFGVSTEDDGRYLNEGLISYKESFGARATVCDFYEIKLN